MNGNPPRPYMTTKLALNNLLTVCNPGTCSLLNKLLFPKTNTGTIGTSPATANLINPFLSNNTAASSFFPNPLLGYPANISAIPPGAIAKLSPLASAVVKLALSASTPSMHLTNKPKPGITFVADAATVLSRHTV